MKKKIISCLFLTFLLVSTTKGRGSNPAAQSVVSFTLINTDTDKDVQTISDGSLIDAKTLGTLNLNIRANTNPGKVGSVVFVLDGKEVKRENGLPYAVGPNQSSGDYFPMRLPLGQHTLMATPYTKSDGGGLKGTPLTIHFTLGGHKIEGFTLIDTDTDKDLQPIVENSIINVTAFKTKHFNIRANTNPGKVGSVVFVLDGKEVKRENLRPYAIGANLPSGNYYPLNIPLGEHTLTATPYGLSNGKGFAGEPLTVHFTLTDTDAGEEQEVEDTEGTLFLENVSDTSFNSSSAALRFRLEGATFFNDLTRQHLYIDNQEIPLSSVTIEPHRITIPYTWKNGLNEIRFLGTDANELMVGGTYSLWAGSNSLPVTTIGPNGQPVKNAVVEVVLSDNTNVKVTGTTDANGKVIFQNIPPRTLVVTAKGPNNLFGTAGIVGFGNPLTIQLEGFDQPSTIDNNDFSQGLAGWNIGSAPAKIIPHDEGQTAKAAAADFDLQLGTAGEGPQSVSRTFTVPARKGTQGTKVRYRFITSEVPGGYYGSQYNDYYSVAVRNQKTGAVGSEGKAMNSFSLSEFDGSGGITWREIEVSASPGDVIQVDVKVANVGDGLYDSEVIVDYVDDSKLEIQSAALKDIDNTDLNYLSLDAHTYFNGKTRVNGSFVIKGNSDAKLAKVELQVYKSQQLIATGKLNSTLTSQVLTTFGSDETISVKNASPLFEIQGEDLGLEPGTVQLRLVATLESGQSKFYDIKTVKIFTRYKAGNNRRFSGRDPLRGGDDWGEPSIVNFIDASLSNSLFLNDLSNMNGGTFQPDHDTHDNGTDLDCRYSQGAPTQMNTVDNATKLLQLLKSPDGERILEVGVTYSKTNIDPFWNAIKNETVASKIHVYKKHTDHFHFILIPKGISTLQADPTFQQIPERSKVETVNTMTLRQSATDIVRENDKNDGVLLVYPNPIPLGGHNLNITGRLGNSRGAMLYVYDYTGKTVYQSVIRNAGSGDVVNVQLDEKVLTQKGIYVIVIRGEKVNFSKKVIVQ